MFNYTNTFEKAYWKKVWKQFCYFCGIVADIFFNGEGITARQGHARGFIKIEALGLVGMRGIWGWGGGVGL